MLKQNKYNQKNTIQIPFRLNRRTDADIIIFFEILKKYDISIAGYLKKMIRENIRSFKFQAKKEIEMNLPSNMEKKYFKFLMEIKEIKEIKEMKGE